MAEAARVDLRVDRWTPFVRKIRFKGYDLNWATFRIQVRAKPDSPGPALIDLGGAADDVTEGIFLVGVDTSGIVPVSTIQVLINEATLANAAHAPAAPRPGEEVILAWDLHIKPEDELIQKWLFGSFIIVPGVTKA